MFIKAIKALICKSTFLKSPINSQPNRKIELRIAHITITKDIVAQALLNQSDIKALDLDKINF